MTHSVYKVPPKGPPQHSLVHQCAQSNYSTILSTDDPWVQPQHTPVCPDITIVSTDGHMCAGRDVPLGDPQAIRRYYGTIVTLGILVCAWVYL